MQTQPSLFMHLLFVHRFTAETFKIVAHSNSGLHSLNLRHSKNWLSDAVLMPVFEISRKLTKLDLTGKYMIAVKWSRLHIRLND